MTPRALQLGKNKKLIAGSRRCGPRTVARSWVATDPRSVTSKNFTGREIESDDRGSKGRPEGAGRPWLAGFSPYVFVRRLLRPPAHGVPGAARDQRASG